MCCAMTLHIPEAESHALIPPDALPPPSLMSTSPSAQSMSSTKDAAYARLDEQMTQLNNTVSTFSRNCDTAISLSSAAQRITLTFDAM